MNFIHIGEGLKKSFAVFFCHFLSNKSIGKFDFTKKSLLQSAEMGLKPYIKLSGMSSHPAVGKVILSPQVVITNDFLNK